MCDGVRCDMAMLMMNDIFAKTWGKRAGAEPRDDFWPSIIRTVKTANPDFLFTAEVYWDREAALLNQGFDFCYDKELYDALIEGSGRHVYARLHQHSAIQQQLLRFIENHDEPRAARMEWRQHQAAAVILASLPGARLYHDGQFDGRIHRVPVQLTRRQAEQKSSSVEAFYTNLLGFDFRGQWRSLSIHKGLFGGASVLSWEWDNYAVIVNFGSRKVNVVLPLSTDGLKLGSIEKKGEHVILQPYGYAIIEK